MKCSASENELETPQPPPLSFKTSTPTSVSSQATSPKPLFPISRYIHNDAKSVLVYFKEVKPVRQEGPCCGIVALSMASQFFPGKNLAAKDVLQAAQTNGFTKNGEMFSANNMAELSESLLCCKATVIYDLLDRKQEVLDCICRGCPVLIPYDADKNHQPCLNNGRNAHWALLNGVCIEVFDVVSGKEMSPWGDVGAMRVSCGSEIDKHFHSAASTHVFAYQGKSNYMALWKLEDLLLSNRNMCEVTKKYSSENMLLPNTYDVLGELRDKAVLLEKT